MTIIMHPKAEDYLILEIVSQGRRTFIGVSNFNDQIKLSSLENAEGISSQGDNLFSGEIRNQHNDNPEKFIAKSAIYLKARFSE
jgi:flagellar basal body rod protein FlgG